jgi:hypothetical protein
MSGPNSEGAPAASGLTALEGAGLVGSAASER